MGYKTTDTTLAKVAVDEPIFVLRGQDRLAPALVRAWAYLAEAHGCTVEKVADAIACAAAMDDWPLRKWPD